MLANDSAHKSLNVVLRMIRCPQAQDSVIQAASAVKAQAEQHHAKFLAEREAYTKGSTVLHSSRVSKSAIYCACQARIVIEAREYCVALP
jgi:hypothetical protein